MGIGQEKIMATETYSISPAGEWVGESSCSCHRRDGGNMMIINNSSLTSSSSSTSSSVSSRRRYRAYGPVLITLIVWLSYLTCCVSAWPVLNTRRSLNYAPHQPPVVIPSDYDFDINQWAMAAQPGEAGLQNYYDELSNLPQQDMYEDQLYEDPAEENYQMQMPYLGFGPIIPEEPEEELELEELKHEQPFTYEKRRSGKVMNTKKPLVASTSPATIAAASKAKSSSSPSTTVATPIKKAGVMNPGQKEIAMLRPPSPKSNHFQAAELEDPKISVAQRSPSNEKPSAYDRLRKYLSLDDALKKEYQQRRASAVSRHTKRESISSIITDSDSLTGQLNGLKKNMD